MFEHDSVSENINKWIDLIFGYKQKGEEAIEARNLYPSITYEDGIDINKPENQQIKSSLIVQAFNYGQCPTQLFNEPHAKKEPSKAVITFMDDKPEIQSKTYDFQKNKYGLVTSGKFIDDHNFILFGSKRTLLGFTYNQFTGDPKKETL